MEEILHTMSEAKRQRIMDQLNAYEEHANDILKRREIARLERERKKRLIVVKDMQDFMRKYEDYNVDVNIIWKTATLRKPLEVQYLSQFRYDCSVLNLTPEIRSN